MLFNEIYSCYYNAVAKILDCAVEGTLTDKKMYEIVRQTAFSESVVTIPAALKEQKWPLLSEDYSTPIIHKPTMPLTNMQKRWLKSLLSDPRIMLFEPSVQGLEDINPLYPADFFVYFDRYEDSDPFDSPDYINNFKTALTALKEKRKLNLEFIGGKGAKHNCICIPISLEYSQKDDKFRLIALCKNNIMAINVARITYCQADENYSPDEYIFPNQQKKTLILELTDTRNALERLMIQFSHMEKETIFLDENRYRVKIEYLSTDEHELVIQLLSFGQNIKVLQPYSLISQLKGRILAQKNFLNSF